MLNGYLCTGPEETFSAGESLAALLIDGDTIGLKGELGAGKTLFVQGLARGLLVPDTTSVTSPTFSLVNEYTGGRLSLVHMDLYRIEEASELEHLGLDEMIDLAGVSAVEWYERFSVLPEDHLRITIEIPDHCCRHIHASGTGPRSMELASKWRETLS